MFKFLKFSDATGGALIEFSIVIGAFLMMALGFLEVSRWLIIENWLEHAAKRGLTVAAVPVMSPGLELPQTDPAYAASAQKVRTMAREEAMKSGWITLGAGSAYLDIVSNRDTDLEVPVSAEFSTKPIKVTVHAEVHPLFPFFPPITITGSASGYREGQLQATNSVPGRCAGSDPTHPLPMDNSLACGCGADPPIGNCGCPQGFELAPNMLQCVCSGGTGAPWPGPCDEPDPCPNFGPENCAINEYPVQEYDHNGTATCGCLPCNCGYQRSSNSITWCDQQINPFPPTSCDDTQCRALICNNDQWTEQCGAPIGAHTPDCQLPHVILSDCSCGCPPNAPPCGPGQSRNPTTCQCEPCSQNIQCSQCVGGEPMVPNGPNCGCQCPEGLIAHGNCCYDGPPPGG